MKREARKKVEVFVDNPLYRKVRDLGNAAGVVEHTVVRTIGGESASGRWRDDQVTGGAASKVVYTAFIDAQTCEGFLKVLEPVIDEYGLLVSIKDVEIVRP